MYKSQVYITLRFLLNGIILILAIYRIAAVKLCVIFTTLCFSTLRYKIVRIHSLYINIKYISHYSCETLFYELSNS